MDNETEDEALAPVNGRSAISLPQKKCKALSRSFETLGFGFLDGKHLMEIQKAGAELDPSTMMRASRVGAYIGQQGLLSVFKQLLEINENTKKSKDKIRLAGTIAAVARNLTATNKEMADTARKEVPKNAAPVVGTRTFVPLQVVVQMPNQQHKQEAVVELQDSTIKKVVAGSDIPA